MGRGLLRVNDEKCRRATLAPAAETKGRDHDKEAANIFNLINRTASERAIPLWKHAPRREDARARGQKWKGISGRCSFWPQRNRIFATIYCCVVPQRGVSVIANNCLTACRRIEQRI